jgi:pimeloyl-ACP methyl ester carboxylesterase
MLEELLDDADLAVFFHGGHWPMIERTAEFNRLVRDFFLSG